MGGPDVPGPCTYSDGSTRIGNGFAGSPGEVVRLDQNGNTLYEAPAALKGGETTQRCDSIPRLSVPTCANPHGIQAREDLHTLVTSDYNEPRNIILNPVQAPSSYLRRPTVRTWDISDLDHPKLKAVSFLPDGPRVGNDRQRLPIEGAQSLRWRQDGRELFAVGGDGALWVVPVESRDGGLRLGAAEKLFAASFVAVDFDVYDNGGRFLFRVDPAAEHQSLGVVLNWPARLGGVTE